MAEAKKIDGLKFNFSKITAFEVEDFVNVFRSNELRKQAEILAKFCTACPPEWGDPNNPDTFGNLPWFGDVTFMKVRNAFMDAFSDPAKN